MVEVKSKAKTTVQEMPADREREDLAEAVRPFADKAAEKVADTGEKFVSMGKFLLGRGASEKLGNDFELWMKVSGGRTKWMLLERYGVDGAGAVVASGDHEHEKIEIDCCALLADQGPEFGFRVGADIEQAQGNLSVKRQFQEGEMVSRLIQRGFDRDVFAADWSNQAGGT